MRVDICDSDDHEMRNRLLAALHRIGAAAEEGDLDFGVGLNRFRLDGEGLTVFMDAWGIDLAGPDGPVRRVLDAMADDV